MKRIAVSLSLLFALSAVAVGQQPPRTQKPAAGSYQVSGRIINGATGQPLAGATVSLGPTMNAQAIRPLQPMRQRRVAEEEIPTVVSAEDGSFTFTGLRAGKYSLAASKRGFSQQTYQEHDQYSTALVIGPDKDPGELLFRVEPDASVVGRVFDEHSEPVANAQVMLFREGMQNGRRGIYRTQTTQTSDEGIYKFSHIRAGKFYIAVSASPWYSQYGNYRGRMVINSGGGIAGGGGVTGFTGRGGGDNSNAELDVAFPLTFYPGVTDSARAEVLDLKPGQRESVDFTLTAIPAIHLRVMAPSSGDQEQFVNANVNRQVFDSTDMGGMRTRMMNTGQGVTEISGLTPGHYSLQIHLNGPNRGPTPALVRDIDVNGDMDINVGDAPTGVNVSGTLRFEGPAPTEPVRLMLRRRGPVPPFQLQVGPKGEISSSSTIPPDTYELMLPGVYQMNQITAAGAKIDGQSIVVGSSDVHLNIVAARSSARIDGFAEKVGAPVSGAMIVLVPSDMERPLLFRRDQSDSDGSFTLGSVTPGKYTLIALENAWDLEWSKPEVLKPYLAGGQPLDIAVDGKYNIKVNVQ